MDIPSSLLIEPVLPSARPWPLHDVAASRQVEREALAACPPFTLMERAGLATARLAMAVAPHAEQVWVACGPGNNGGDGLVAARHLHLAGRRVQVSLLGHPATTAPDAAHALAMAQAAGVRIDGALPDQAPHQIAIDALLGIGANRAPSEALAAAIDRLNACGAPIVAVDLPSGLDADTGSVLGTTAVAATHTLSMLTLKPGQFTHAGRDHCGRLWHASLGTAPAPDSATAELGGPPRRRVRTHGQHKGSFGDVVVLGGAPGMGGAAVLAARAALAAGAGRVYLARLDGRDPQTDPARPELMPRMPQDVLSPRVLASSTVACGCGGGRAIRALLPAVLHHAARLVLDADALNAIAAEAGLARALRARRGRGLATVLTPHPLEAARLLGIDTAQVQQHRMDAAVRLAQQCEAAVVLKGSGSVIAAAQARSIINPTGNARLATAGSGDVLAGWMAGRWAQQTEDDVQRIAAEAAWLHGRAAEHGDQQRPLLAADLIDRMMQV